MINVGEATLKIIRCYGAIFEMIDIDNRIIKISVPERSEILLYDNKTELACDELVESIKFLIAEYIRERNIKVMYRIRKGSKWTIDNMNKTKKEAFYNYKELI